MGIKEILFKHKDELEKKVDERIESVKEQAKRDIDEYTETLSKASEMVLPVNLIEILESGGQIQVMDVKNAANCSIRANQYYKDVNLDPLEIYRIIVIVERIEQK